MLTGLMVAMFALMLLVGWYLHLRWQRLHRRYHTLQQHAGDAVVVISADGKLIHASASIYQVLGYSASQILEMETMGWLLI